MKLLFVSRNKFKHAEATRFLSTLGISVEASHLEIHELQTVDTDALVRDKATRAFAELGRPLFVEHTGLYLDALNGFPGGLTQMFWDTIKKERFAELFASETDRVKAVTHIGYVDGRRVHVFRGEIEGKIVSPPRVDHGFQWDCVFQPDGYDETFSELGDKKNDISMRSVALRKLRDHLGLLTT
jgi:XTP/dITP diphosphohydrolase